MITVQIGNTDNKLPQAEWAEFCQGVDELIHEYADEVYFSGASLPFAPWQNAAWCFEFSTYEEDFLIYELALFAHRYRQDSISWTPGETEFIKPQKRP